MMTKEGRTKIVKLMTPKAGFLVLGCGHISHIARMHYIFKNLLLYSHAYIRQTKYIVMITKEGSTKIFMTPAEGILMLGHGFLNQKVEMHYFFENLLYSWAWIRQTNYIVMMTKQSFI